MSEATLNPLECALDEAQALRMQVDALQAENAALRTQLTDVTESMGRVEERCAKLRELVRVMHDELVSCEDNGYVCGGHKFDERVRGLGIEVDG